MEKLSEQSEICMRSYGGCCCFELERKYRLGHNSLTSLVMGFQDFGRTSIPSLRGFLCCYSI